MARENNFGIGDAYGKLFLAGEYAVLAHNKAVILHVPLKLTTKINKSEEFSLNSTFPFSNEIERQKSIDLISELLNYLNRIFEKKANYSLEIVSELFNKRGKLGLGSSGALIISIVKAFLLLYGVEVNSEMIFKISAIFASEYGIKGSYADLAAAINPYHIIYQKPTNLVEFHQKDWAYIREYHFDGLLIEKIEISSPIIITAIHSRIITDSTEGINSFNQLPSSTIDDFNQKSEILVEKLITQLTSNVSCETIKVLNEIGDLLRKLAKELSVSVVCFENSKSSGAFGGDFYLTFRPSSQNKFQFEVKI